MLGQLDSVHLVRDLQLPGLFEEAARAPRSSCWFMSFAVTPGIVRPPRCQPGKGLCYSYLQDKKPRHSEVK